MDPLFQALPEGPPVFRTRSCEADAETIAAASLIAAEDEEFLSGSHRRRARPVQDRCGAGRDARWPRRRRAWRRPRTTRRRRPNFRHDSPPRKQKPDEEERRDGAETGPRERRWRRGGDGEAAPEDEPEAVEERELEPRPPRRPQTRRQPTVLAHAARALAGAARAGEPVPGTALVARRRRACNSGPARPGHAGGWSC